MWWKLALVGLGLWLVSQWWKTRRPNIQQWVKQGQVDKLIRALDHEDQQVQLQAIRGLGKLAPESALEPLHWSLLCQVAFLSAAAADALGDLACTLRNPNLVQQIVDYLIGHWVGPSYVSKADADRTIVAVLASIGSPAVVALVQTLGNSKGLNYARGLAVQTLAKIKDDRAIVPLSELLETGDEYLRTEAAKALGAFPQTATVSKLLALLQDPKPELRVIAIQVLEKLKAKEAVSAILAALEQTDPKVRLAAAVALGTVQDKNAIPRLILKLTDPERMVRDAAAKSLKQLGSPLPPPEVLLAEARLLYREINTQSHEGSWMWHFGVGPSGKPQPKNTKEAVLELLQNKYTLTKSALDTLSRGLPNS